MYRNVYLKDDMIILDRRQLMTAERVDELFVNELHAFQEVIGRSAGSGDRHRPFEVVEDRQQVFEQVAVSVAQRLFALFGDTAPVVLKLGLNALATVFVLFQAIEDLLNAILGFVRLDLELVVLALECAILRVEAKLFLAEETKALELG